MSGPSALEELRVQLRNFPEIRWSEREREIEVHPRDYRGFSVTLIEDGDESIVMFEMGWHRHFTDPYEAVRYVGLGLSNNWRVRELRRGDFAHKWTLQCRGNGRWVDDWTVGLIFYPFWRQKSVVYYQNDVLCSPS